MLARMLLSDSPLAHITRQMAGEMDRFMSSYAAPGAVPALNAWQSDEAITVEAELPGYRLEDIEILAHDESLTIRGQRTVSAPEGATELRSERVTGSFERTVSLPAPIDVERVSAALRDGVLTITLPLTPEVKPRRVAITG